MNNRHRTPSSEKKNIRMRLYFLKSVLLLLTLLGLSGCAHRALRFSFPESSLSYGQAWESALEASLLFYDRIAINDKEGGYFQTTWDIHKVGHVIGNPVKRSRLIGRAASKVPFRLDLDIEQQAFSMELGRWVSDPPDKKRLGEIVERVRVRLRL